MKNVFLFLFVLAGFAAMSQQTQKEKKEVRVILKKHGDSKEDSLIENRKIIMMTVDDGGKMTEKTIENGDTTIIIRGMNDFRGAMGPNAGMRHPRIMKFRELKGEKLGNFEWSDKEGNHFMPRIEEFRMKMEDHLASTIQGLMINPNAPFDGKLNVRFNAENKGNVTIAVMDINGKEIAKSEIKDFEGHYLGQIDVKGKEKGVYFVRVVQNGDGMIKRIKIN